MIHEFTIPYSLQQNDWIEWLHGNLLPNAGEIFEETKLNLCFFGKMLINPINFIHNRIPHSGFNNSIPFELL